MNTTTWKKIIYCLFSCEKCFSYFRWLIFKCSLVYTVDLRVLLDVGRVIILAPLSCLYIVYVFRKFPANWELCTHNPELSNIFKSDFHSQSAAPHLNVLTCLIFIWSLVISWVHPIFHCTWIIFRSCLKEKLWLRIRQSILASWGLNLWTLNLHVFCWTTFHHSWRGLCVWI